MTNTEQPNTPTNIAPPYSGGLPHVFVKQADGLYTLVRADGSRIPNCDYHERMNSLGYRETVYNDGRVHPTDPVPRFNQEPRQDSYYLYTQRVCEKIEAELAAAGKVNRSPVRITLLLSNGDWHKYEEVARAAYFANAVDAVASKSQRGWVSVSYNNSVYRSYASASRATGTSVAKIKRLAAKGLEGWAFANASTAGGTNVPVAPTGATVSTTPGKNRGVAVSYNNAVYPSYAVAHRENPAFSVAQIKRLAAKGLDGWALANTSTTPGKKRCVAVSHYYTVYPSLAAAHRENPALSAAKIKRLADHRLDGWNFVNASTPPGANVPAEPTGYPKI